jgi:hypothetical protein
VLAVPTLSVEIARYWSRKAGRHRAWIHTYAKGVSGRTPEELSRQYEPSAHAIRNQVAQADRDEGKLTVVLTSAEREILSKAAA